MASKSKLELLLTATNKLSPVVKKVSSDIKGLGRDATKTLNNLNKLIKQIGSSPKNNFGKQFASDIRKSNSEANKLKKTLQSIGNIKIKSPKIETPKSESSSRSKTRSNPKEELDNLFDKKRKPKSKIDRLADINERILEPVSEIKNVWKEKINSVRELTEETKQLYLAQARFKLINLSDADNQKAFDAATKSARKFGLTTHNQIELVTDLHNAFGNLDAAIEALPLASKYKFSMQTLYGDRFSSAQIDEQIQNTSKFLELTGKTAKGREEMEKAFNVITQISSSTSGRITGADFLNMGKTGGTAVQNLTPEGIRNISSIMQELGGDRTGTSLMSMYQALVGGVMKQSAAERFDYFGLLDKAKIEFGKAQKIKRILPGANKLGDPMMENPLTAADMLRDAMKTKGVNTDDSKEVNKELALLFQNRNAQRLMSILMNQRGQVLKEAGLAENAQNADQMYAGIDNNLKKLQEVENAWVDLKAKAGVPLIQMFGKMAETATPVLNFFSEHDKLTQWGLAALVVGKGLSGIIQTAAALKTSGMLSFFTGAGESADGASKKIAGFTRSLDTATKKTGIFQKITSSPITGGLVAAGAFVALDTIIEKLGKIQELKGKLQEDTKTLNQSSDRLSSLGLSYNTPGNFKDKAGNDQTAEFNNVAAKFLETIKAGRTLELGLHPERKSWGEWIADAITPTAEMNPYGRGKSGEYDPEMAANKWKREGLTKDLHDVNVLARVIQAVKNDSTLNQSDAGLLISTFEKIAGEQKVRAAQEILKPTIPQQQIPPFPFPTPNNLFNSNPNFQSNQQLAQQTDAVKQSFSQIIQPTTSLGEQFTNLNTNSTNASTSVGTLATETNSAANRIRNVQFTPPTIAPIRIPMIQTPYQGFNFGGGRARGGSMQKGHTYRINEIGQELFTPATSGSMVSNDVLRKTNPSGQAVSINFSPAITVNSDNPNAEQLKNEIFRELAIMKNNLLEELSPRMTTKKVYSEMDREAGRG